ncbi:ferritin heavy chain B-like [Amblyraja radiata]|uniref:ferritin heavy chain B-like n=1 Tax=Amblyraja radiata TaxID=386614 RepID=UPI001403D218|nr:ferritin heavy chain B-like [Amblyraja radiata]
MLSQVRYNFHPDCELSINKLVSLKYYTSYVHLAMSFYFERDDVALENFAKSFREMSAAGRGQADKLIDFQTLRGGRVQLQDIEKPAKGEWRNGLEATQDALELQKNVNKSLLDLHQLATNKEDPQLCNFLESNFLNDNVVSMKTLGDHVTSLKGLNAGRSSGMGEYLFDKHTLE